MYKSWDDLENSRILAKELDENIIPNFLKAHTFEECGWYYSLSFLGDYYLFNEGNLVLSSKYYKFFHDMSKNCNTEIENHIKIGQIYFAEAKLHFVNYLQEENSSIGDASFDQIWKAHEIYQAIPNQTSYFNYIDAFANYISAKLCFRKFYEDYSPEDIDKCITYLTRATQSFQEAGINSLKKKLVIEKTILAPQTPLQVHEIQSITDELNFFGLSFPERAPQGSNISINLKYTSQIKFPLYQFPSLKICCNNYCSASFELTDTNVHSLSIPISSSEKESISCPLEVNLIERPWISLFDVEDQYFSLDPTEIEGEVSCTDAEDCFNQIFNRLNKPYQTVKIEIYEPWNLRKVVRLFWHYLGKFLDLWGFILLLLGIIALIFNRSLRNYQCNKCGVKHDIFRKPFWRHLLIHLKSYFIR